MADLSSKSIPFGCGAPGQKDAIGRTQATGAKGYLMCNGKPASGVKIKMYDDDSGIDTDDFMAETKTDSNGYFSLSGNKSELLTIDVK
uniref:Carboxypeptidase regulatory-like domain-containing protein n=1 Tax=Parastrongyloides trichosuri TaxID=131310 RepID=A0A0N4ZDV9_PARTI